MELFPKHESKLIKDTTREQREEIVRRALRCSEGCENCTGCALGFCTLTVPESVRLQFCARIPPIL